VGADVGDLVGSFVTGLLVGSPGVTVGISVGEGDGLGVGNAVGLSDGLLDGSFVGMFVGLQQVGGRETQNTEYFRSRLEKHRHKKRQEAEQKRSHDEIIATFLTLLKAMSLVSCWATQTAPVLEMA
jgi:hypothetical protein